MKGKGSMGLIKKIVILSIGILVASVLFSTLTTARLFLISARQSSSTQVELISDILSSYLYDDLLGDLEAYTYDVGYWDETYAYMDRYSSDYRKAQLVDSTLDANDVGFVYYISSGGSIHDSHISSSLGMQDSQVAALSDRLLELAAKAEGLEEQILTGFFLFEDQLVPVSLGPVMHTDDSGPANGILISGDIVSHEELFQLSDRFHVQLELVAGSVGNQEVSRLSGMSVWQLDLEQSMLDGSEVSLVISDDPKLWENATPMIIKDLVSNLVIVLVLAVVILIVLKQEVFLPLHHIATRIKEASGRLSLGLSEDYRPASWQPEGSHRWFEATIEKLLDELDTLIEGYAQMNTLSTLVAQSAPAALILIDQDSMIRMINPYALQIAGLEDRASILGRAVDEIFRFEDDLHSLDERVPVKSRVSIPGGASVPVLLQGRQVLLGKRPYRLIFMLDDSQMEEAGRTILEYQRSLEQQVDQLAAANARLSEAVSERIEAESRNSSLERQLMTSQRLEALGSLARGIAHDFNNILQVLSGYCELLQVEEDEGMKKELTMQMLHGCGSGRDLVSQLLSFGRSSSVQLQPLELGSFIQQFSSMIRRVLPKNIELRQDHSIDSLDVRADRGQLEQVLLNLCINSRDAMPGGGVITISLGSRRVSSMTQAVDSMIAAGEYATIRLSDTGCGMDKEVLERIFEPLFTTKGEGQGTGLGLSTVYGIIRSHEGYLTVQSRQGEGTSFTIFLPRTEQGEQ